MTRTLLPEFVRSGLALLEKALPPEGPRLPPARMRDLVFLCCSALAPALRRDWDEVRECLGQGIDGKRAAVRLRELSGALEGFLLVADKVLGAARLQSDPYEGQEADTAQLASVLQSAAGMHDE